VLKMQHIRGRLAKGKILYANGASGKFATRPLS